MQANPKLRKWLNHSPRPAFVVCDEQRLDAPKTDRGWAELAETIEQLQPVRIVCFAADGKTVVRAKPFVYFFPDSVDDAPAPTSANESELTTFARLLAGAYSNAGQNFQPIAAHAMDLVERLSAQVARLQTENARLQQQCLQFQAQALQLEVEAAALPEQTGDGGIVGGLIQGIAHAMQNDGAVTPITQAKKGTKK